MKMGNGSFFMIWLPLFRDSGPRGPRAGLKTKESRYNTQLATGNCKRRAVKCKRLLNVEPKKNKELSSGTMGMP